MSFSLPSGVLAAGLTPFDADLALDADALAQHVRRLLRNGCDGVLLFGTTGEGLSLTVEERVGGLHAVLDADLPPDRMLVGTGAAALPDAVRATRAATDAGVGGVLVLPPFHFRQISEEGVYRFYDQLLQRVGHPDLRLYFYHFPELSGVPIPFSVIQRLHDQYPDQIAGVKDSSGEWDHTQALCQGFPDLQIFSGTERFLLPILKEGGAGCISATANVTAPLAARVLAAWKNEEAPEPLQETLTNLRTAFAPLPTIAALKHLFAQRLQAPHWAEMRPPLAPLDEDDRAAVHDIAERLDDTAPMQAPEE